MLDPHPRHHRKMPADLLNLYFSQLLGFDKPELVDKEVDDKLDWIDETHHSYLLWLSYTMVEISTKKNTREKVHLGELKLTQYNTTHKELVKEATFAEIQEYISWIAPKDRAKLWNKHFQDRDMRALFVSPIHFLFFKISRQYYGSRVHRAFTTNEFDTLFCHPIFRVEGIARGSLVVPDYFLGTGASFDGWTSSESAVYHVFPDFAQKLFDYAEQDHHLGGFASFLGAREGAWSPVSGEHKITPPRDPDQVLGRYWRWADVLQMLWDSRKKLEHRVTHPRAFKCAPPSFLNKPETLRYLSTFGEMATIWLKTWSTSK